MDCYSPKYANNVVKTIISIINTPILEWFIAPIDGDDWRTVYYCLETALIDFGGPSPVDQIDTSDTSGMSM